MEPGCRLTTMSRLIAARIATTPNTTLRLPMPGRGRDNVAVVMEVSFRMDYSMARVTVKGISEQVIRWYYKDIRWALQSGLTVTVCESDVIQFTEPTSGRTN